jgi:AcrR family transcriptional regulator
VSAPETALAASPAPTHRRDRAARGDGHMLRAEILAAARELLETTGSVQGVSMRAIAQRVGVTTPAIYLHFSDKQHLMQAVVADAFAQLGAAVRQATRTPKTPTDRLLACGRAYVAFAQERPEHYRLALTSQTGATCADRAPVRAVLQFLKPLVDDYVAAEPAPAPSAAALTLDLWATAHGVASLLVVTPQLQWGDIPAFVERTLCATLHGSRDVPDRPRNHPKFQHRRKVSVR